MDVVDRIDRVLDDFTEWSGLSADSADSTVDDLDDGPQPTGEYLIARSDVDLGHPVYPDDELGRDHHGCPVWGLFTVMAFADGWEPELVMGSITLNAARALADEMGVTRLLGD